MPVRKQNCNTAPNPCGTTNGGCSHFCLLSAVDPKGYSCDCPDGMMLDDDMMNCNFHIGATTETPPLSIGSGC